MHKLNCEKWRIEGYAYASIASAVLFVLSLVLFPSFVSSRSYADDAPTVTPNLTIGSSGNLAFSVNPGQFNTGSQDITVTTTNYTGYTLTAVPEDDDSRLVNSTASSYITSIEEDTTSSNFDSAEYGFSTDTTISSSTTYKPVASSTEIKKTNAPTNSTNGTFTLTIGAKAGVGTPAGTYTRTFTLTALANEVVFAITYDDNTTDEVTNMPSSPQTAGNLSGTLLELASEIPVRSGYTFLGWDTDSSATTATFSAGGNYNLDQTTSNEITLYAIWSAKTYTITLDGNGATSNNHSITTTATYDSTTLSAITRPSRSYTVSGFNLTTSATNATISATTTLTANYTFNGWYKETGATNKIASNAATPALSANTTYTDANSKWNYTTAGSITLYAGWTSKAVTLPTITREGSTCGWATTDGATTWNYNSGASYTPTANTTLYGVCRTDITLNKNGGSGGSASTTATYGATTLATISNPTRANSTGTRTVSGFTLTTSGTNATVTYGTSGNCTSSSNCKSTNTTTYTFNGWYKESGATNKIASNATTPALQASTTYTDANSKWTYTTAGAITLYAGWTTSAGAYSSVTLPTITRTGSTCGWATSSTATSWNYNSGASITPTGNLTLYGVCVTNITLNKNGATNSPTGSTTVAYNATSLGAIATLPQRKYNVSGFTLTTSATNATVSATTTLTSTYTFNGWYKESGATNKIASNAATPALSASTTYTDANSKWTYTTAGAITLYAGWTSKAVTLPTITRTGSTCGWSTSSTATTISYASGASFTPTAATTLYGVCVTDITLNKNGATNSPTGSTTVAYNATSLGAIATLPQRKYTASGFTLTASGANATVSSTSTLTATYTFNGWYKETGATNKIASNAATPALQASTTYTDANSKWTYTTAGAITLYAGWTSASITLPTITRTGSTCGWATSNTATSWTYNSGASVTPTANLTLYGVCRTNITLNANGGSGGSSSATVAYNATSLSTVTNPTRANSTGTRTVKGFTLTTSGTNATVSSTSQLSSTNTTTYTFNGWYKETGATNKIASNAATPALQASTTYTDANSKWTYTTAGAITLYAGWTTNAGAYSSVTLPTITRTGSTCGWATSSTATSWNYDSGASITPSGNLTLYGVCRTNITLNKNGGTNSPTTSTTATYGATNLAAIATLPQRKYTVSGFTKPSGNNADGATVSSTTTLTSTYTFKGWYKESGATNKIASNAATPALSASTTYTDASSKWTYTTAGSITLYAGWTSKAVTLPTITRNGYTCGWTTTSTGATTIQYESGASFTPTANTTLYGVCKENIPYIQDFTASQCQTLASGSNYTVMDRRDNNEYTVSYLAGNCWMTQNLRITGTISATYSNFTTPSTFNVSQNTYGNTTTELCGDGTASVERGFINVCSLADDTTGWYNYMAASVGVVSGYTPSPNSGTISADICPSNWRLPTNNEMIALDNLIEKDYSIFSVPGNGYYQANSKAQSGYEYWWSSEYLNYNAYDMRYNGTNVYAGDTRDRDRGQSIRCVRSS
ncbi:InlB B-repeat-containing protein [Candidatus Saccharibacteria bacterium]|nr:InlB B-repeat-containing protein [Candidatus Saccharibacteria bacterium]